MSPQAKAGRSTLLRFIALMLLASAATIAMYMDMRGTERLPVQFARFLLTAILCLLLYHGNQIAKVISIVLCIGAGALAFPLVFQNDPFVIAWGGSLYLLYLSFARALYWSANVNAFLEHQRTARRFSE